MNLEVQCLAMARDQGHLIPECWGGNPDPLQIIKGDCLDVLKTLPDESVHCCVTSPPYWGLRNYNVDGQIGLEVSPKEYVAKMVQVFREVRRVLKGDGTCWINIGDIYAGNKEGNTNGTYGRVKQKSGVNENTTKRSVPNDLKPKDLVGIPWRVAFALQADGWYLRQDIIWSKPNPMPESVTDRCTKSHEYIFLLSKSKRYYFDQEAIKIEAKSATAYKMPDGWDTGNGSHGSFHRKGREKGKKWNTAMAGGANGISERRHLPYPKANKRSVWTVTTKGFKGAHFATYPPDLIKPCILAGCPVGGIVLDPFAGSGTTGQVALENGRKAILIELNPEYIKLINERCASSAVLELV